MKQPDKPLSNVIRLLPRSIVTADVQTDHLLPPGPIVAPAIPDTQGMPDVLAPQDARKALVISIIGVIAADNKDTVYMSQCLQPLRIVLVFQKVHWIVEIHIIVSIAASEPFDIVDATHTYYTINQVWIAKGKIGGVVSSKAGACGDQEWVGVHLRGER